MTAAPLTMIANLQLEEVEKAIYLKDYENASRLLLTGLRKLKQGAQFIGYRVDPRVNEILYTRLAAAIVAMLSDPAFGISQTGFDHFASEHAVIDTVFRASTFNTSDHMLPVLASNPDEADKSKLQIQSGAGLVKFLLTYSLRSGFGLDFEATFKRNPQSVAALWAGMISPLLTTAVLAHDRRELLLGLHRLFVDVSLPDAALPALSDAYMYSSYATRADKHDMKATVHHLFARVLRDRGVRLPEQAVMTRRRSRQLDANELPRILICTEWFGHLHAMFRCYAPIIRQLRSRFYLIGMSRACDIDEIAKQEFDEWHEVPTENLVFNTLVKTIVSDIRPDVIYYPSLGMAMWWVVLASVRLAPIQVMTLGHPASSRSPAMDYVICEEGAIGDPALFTEKIVEIPSSSARFVMRPDAEMPLPTETEAPLVTRVAIPAMVCKLNAPFMAALREIKEKAVTSVEFHFFVNMIGLNLHQADREICDWLPGSVVHERTTYPDYLKRLQRCHLHLCTWPFGGTNSNIDSMLLGIPVLALEGLQPHERFDAMMVRHAGFDGGLIATDRADYVAKAVGLIDDPGVRARYSDQLKATDLEGLFFGEPAADRREAFVDAMSTIYELHESLGRVTRIKPK